MYSSKGRFTGFSSGWCFLFHSLFTFSFTFIGKDTTEITLVNAIFVKARWRNSVKKLMTNFCQSLHVWRSSSRRATMMYGSVPNVRRWRCGFIRTTGRSTKSVRNVKRWRSIPRVHEPSEVQRILPVERANAPSFVSFVNILPSARIQSPG